VEGALLEADMAVAIAVDAAMVAIEKELGGTPGTLDREVYPTSLLSLVKCAGTAGLNLALASIAGFWGDLEGERDVLSAAPPEESESEGLDSWLESSVRAVKNEESSYFE
jgi:hypothetical protein